MKTHVVLSLTVFAFYILVYVFVIRISKLKPFSAGTLLGLVTYLVVVFAEGLYARPYKQLVEGSDPPKVDALPRLTAIWPKGKSLNNWLALRANFHLPQMSGKRLI